jgi:adenosylcobinamide-phosphate synthase
MTQILITTLLALALDRFVPDRGGFQLFSWYGEWAESIEQRFNGGTRTQGIGAVLLALVPIVFGVFLARYILSEISNVLAFIFDVLVLYVCLDLYRLGKLAVSISEALEEGDLPTANARLQELTGKHPDFQPEAEERKRAIEVSEVGIAQGTIETILKQGNSLVIAPLFWFIVLGPAGVVLERFAAVLDKLWGHRSQRFAQFGWAAARLNDVLGWVPARITALSYAVMGSFEDALHCWRQQAGMWSDINSGPLLASGFGAMHMQSYEEANEDGNLRVEPSRLGVTADATDIRRVVALLWRVLLFWLAVGILMVGVQVFEVFFH